MNQENHPLGQHLMLVVHVKRVSPHGKEKIVIICEGVGSNKKYKPVHRYFSPDGKLIQSFYRSLGKNFDPLRIRSVEGITFVGRCIH